MRILLGCILSILCNHYTCATITSEIDRTILNLNTQSKSKSLYSITHHCRRSNNVFAVAPLEKEINEAISVMIVRDQIWEFVEIVKMSVYMCCFGIIPFIPCTLMFGCLAYQNAFVVANKITHTRFTTWCVSNCVSYLSTICYQFGMNQNFVISLKV